MALVAGGWNDALLVEEGDQSEYLKVIFNEIECTISSINPKCGILVVLKPRTTDAR